MTIWVLESIMMLQVAGVQPWHTVLMVQGWFTEPFLFYLLKELKKKHMIKWNYCFLRIWMLGVYSRLFSCGTSKDGESYIVEWNESEGAVKRTYQGFRKRSSGVGVVQFDTTKNRFLAAGDDFSIKFWDMDNVQLLTSIDADGGLPVSSLSSLKVNFVTNITFICEK